MSAVLKYELQETSASLKDQNRSIDLRLSELKNLIRISGGQMDSNKYRKCCNSQAKLMKEKQAIEAELAKIKIELRKIADKEHAARLNDSGGGFPTDDKNPSAFPLICEGDPNHYIHATGMTLRDYFAGQAISGLVMEGLVDGEQINCEVNAEFAYALADAMLAERGRA